MSPDTPKAERLWMAPDLSMETLAELARSAAPVEPPVGFWDRIERRLDAEPPTEHRSFSHGALTARW